MLIRLNMHVSGQNFYIWHSASSWLVPQITAAYISVRLYFFMIVYCHCKYLFQHNVFLLISLSLFIISAGSDNSAVRFIFLGNVY